MPAQRFYPCFCYFHLGLDQVHRAANILTGGHDLKDFYSVHTQVTDMVHTIYSLDIRRDEEDMITTRVTGNRFLYNMVRIIAGALIAAGMGQIRPEKMEQILGARERRQAGPTAPVRELILVEMRCVD